MQIIIDIKGAYEYCDSCKYCRDDIDIQFCEIFNITLEYNKYCGDYKRCKNCFDAEVKKDG